MKLNEIADITNSELHKKVEAFHLKLRANATISGFLGTPYTITDGRVNIHGDVILNNIKLKEIPFPFGRVEGDFQCAYNPITSLKNSPEHVGGDFWISDSPRLESLEHLPKIVKGAATIIRCNKIRSLVNTDIIFSDISIHGSIKLSFDKIRSGGLSLLLIKNLKKIEFVYTEIGKWTAPFMIIAKYVGRPEDIFDCQAELLAAGYEEYAQL